MGRAQRLKNRQRQSQRERELLNDASEEHQGGSETPPPVPARGRPQRRGAASTILPDRTVEGPRESDGNATPGVEGGTQPPGRESARVLWGHTQGGSRPSAGSSQAGPGSITDPDSPQHGHGHQSQGRDSGRVLWGDSPEQPGRSGKSSQVGPSPTSHTDPPRRNRANGNESLGFTSNPTLPAKCLAPANISITNVPNEDSRKTVTSRSNSKGPTQTGAQFVVRPGFGSVGAPVEVLTNYLGMKLPTWAFYEYSILINVPTRLSRQSRRTLVKLMIESWPLLQETKGFWATDWIDQVISWSNLSADTGKEPECGDVIDGPTVDFGGKDISTQLRFCGQLNLDGLKRFIGGVGHDKDQDPTRDIRALNTIVSAHASIPDGIEGVFQAGDNRYFVKAGWEDIGGGLVAMRGYYSSVRPGMSQMLLNVNTVMSAFITPCTVQTFIQTFYNMRGRSMELSPDQRKELGSRLKGIQVRILYSRAGDGKETGIDSPMRRTKTIRALGEPPSRQAFRMNEEVHHVKSYLETARGIKIDDDSLPCVDLGGSGQPPMWFPPEKLWILPFQLFRGKLNDEQTGEMIKIACRKPVLNVAAIVGEGLPSLGIHPTESPLNQSGLQIGKDLLRIPGRHLISPKVLYNQQRTLATRPQWNLKDVNFLTSKASQTVLHMVHLAKPSDTLDIRILYNEVFQEFRRYGMKLKSDVENAKRVHLNAISSSESKESFRAQLSSCMSSIAQRETNALLFMILPDGNKWLYAVIRRLADAEFGIPTVCVLREKVSDKNNNPHNMATRAVSTNVSNRGGEKSKLRDVLANVAMKANLKLGGTNHSLEASKFSKLLTGGKVDTIIFGADVAHPTAQSTQGTPSIAAVVASIDDKFGRFPGSMRLQKGKVEMIQELRAMVFERLKAWFQANNNRLPTKVLFYRDGVSESQYATVCDEELPQIVQALEVAKKQFKLPNYRPLVTLVVVSKRHHTRFYQYPLSFGSTANQNTQAGLVVDSEVTSPYDFDFYLQAHKAIMGTAKPAHYYVLQNGMGLNADDLQRLTFELSFTYARSTTSVSYAPPAYYADHLCERGRMYIKDYLDGLCEGPTTAAEVASDRRAWYRNDDSQRPGPWHPNLDGTMFYM
ncbi:MAG: hypothetical protein M1837_006753 [Sclerophora amabilis]|nr:MAG: hypothetical protein M1837_006753 [Sclerophora amabilis]